MDRQLIETTYEMRKLNPSLKTKPVADSLQLMPMQLLFHFMRKMDLSL